jgi:hypothetical protein
MMKHRQQDSDLAVIRDKDVSAKLPPEGPSDWRSSRTSRSATSEPANAPPSPCAAQVGEEERERLLSVLRDESLGFVDQAVGSGPTAFSSSLISWADRIDPRNGYGYAVLGKALLKPVKCSDAAGASAKAMEFGASRLIPGLTRRGIKVLRAWSRMRLANR